MSKGCIIFKNGEIEDVFSEPLSLCSSPPFAYIECAQLKKIVKNLSVVVTTNEFQNSCIFYLKFFRIYKRTDGSLLFMLSIIKDENSIRKRALWAKMKKLDFFVTVLWDTFGHPINSRLRKSRKDMLLKGVLGRFSQTLEA